MDWLPATLIGLGLLAATCAIGFVLKHRTGRIRDTAEQPGATAPAELLGLGPGDLGERATLVQFSTEFCGQCPGVARSLGALAGEVDGVRHVEIDLTNRADLVTRFNVLQTPTTLILDADGVQRGRIGGVPRPGAVRAGLDDLTGSLHV
ncbi:TlpA family protein disulfide reductase [Agromyces archimandritae]|uniref:Thioredoxin family protein n=1 Tax=Agromyces archimandritae TaxID=2781962 RepID=A0A975FMW1_9MICO|nr:thioredoxin family protein [Agromyces archimandritae]QTX05034.1 thioredoxin family protein [Agromyces archimandritae]